MKELNFHRATSIANAVELRKSKADGKYLGGGQSLIPVLKLEMSEPSDLISVAKIKEIHGVCVDGDKLAIGATTTHAEVAESADVQRLIPALANLASHIGDAQVRNRGTIGGSVAHADPAADYPAAVLGLGATIKTDRRTIAADGFFKGLFETELQPDELIVSVHFPVPERAAYVKFASHASKYALVGVFVAKTASGVHVAVTGAAANAFRVEAFEKALSAKFAPEALDGLTVDATDLLSDADADADYRAHLVSVLARRAVTAALG
jgi:carbon-monoxide dehydrogenase medium subunit